MSNIGKVFLDRQHLDKTGEWRHYAVGRTGFIDLVAGDFVRFDSQFNSEFFSRPAFEQLTVTLGE